MTDRRGNGVQAGGTLANVVEAPPDLRPAMPAPEPASNSELFAASRVFASYDRSDAEQQRIARGYQPIVQALGLRESQNPASFYNNVDNYRNPILIRSDIETEPQTLGINRPRQEQNIARLIRERRRTNPNFLPGIPDNVEGLHALFLENEKKRRNAAGQVLQRSSNFAGTLSTFAGGAVETTLDPINLATLPLGGGGKTVLGIAAREALLNGALEAVQAPIVAQNRAELGEDYTLRDFGTSVLYAGLGGGLFGTAGHVGARGAGRAYDFTVGQVFNAMPEAVQRRWADRMRVGDTPIAEFYGSLSDRDATRFARDMIGAGRMAPEERAAATVLDRASEVAEASPFRGTAAGDNAYTDGLSGAMHALMDRQPLPPEPRLAMGRDLPQSRPTMPPATLRDSTIAVGDRAQSAPTIRAGDDGAIGGYLDRVMGRESSGDARAQNRDSSAGGHFQFIDSTWVEYYRRRFGRGTTAAAALAHKFDPAIQRTLARDLTEDNAAQLSRAGQPVNAGTLYLAHFLGPSDAIKVLRADPARPVEGLIRADSIASNPKVLPGKTASQVAQWAQRRMGGDAAAVPIRPGSAIGGEVDGGDFRVAQLRDEALALQRQAIGEERLAGGGSIPPMTTRTFRPSELAVDAERFQFKSGGDAFGVSDRLAGIIEWNPMLAGRVIAWEDNAGRVFVADGHQRSGLARRIEAQTGGRIDLDAVLLREADGVTAEDARVWAALKNIAEGTGTPIDAAKVIRDAGREVLDHLPPRSPLVRDGAALARLSDDAFGAVYNGVIPADQAAVIGHLLPDQPDAHAAMIDLLAKLDPANRGQAESIVRQGIAAGFHRETQAELFGAREMTSSLFLERAKVLERGLARLRKLKLVYGTAAREADTLEQAGSSIARDASAKEAANNAQALEIVSRLAFSAGTPVADALNGAAAKLAAGGKLGDVVGEFVRAIRDVDLNAAVRSTADDSGRLAPDGAGRGGDAGEADAALPPEPGDPREPSLADLEDAGQVSMFDVAQGERFSDPAHGEGPKAQSESLTHDVKMDVERQAAPEVAQLARGVADMERVTAGQRGAKLDDLLERARVNQNELGAAGVDLAQRLGVEWINPGAKTAASARRKFADEGYSDAGAMKDLARGAFLVDTPEQANELLAELAGRFVVADKGWQRLASGYVDRKLIVGFNNGGVAEVQLIPRPIGEFKFGESHKLYQQSRNPATSAEEAARLVEHMREGYERLLAGSSFEAVGNTRAKSAGDSSTPSTGALRASEGADRQAPSSNTDALSPSTDTGRSSSSNNRMDEPSMFPGREQPDPAQAARDRQLAELQAASPLRPGAVDQVSTIGTGLFDAADQPRFLLEPNGTHRDAADVLRELDEDDAAIATLQGCMV